MTTYSANVDPTPVLTAIGDLRSPLWGDERDRTIQLEGAAVAQQAQVFVGLAVAAVMPWVFGRTGVWIGFATIAAPSIGGLCYGRYISARGLKVPSIFAAGERARGGLAMAIIAAFALGVVRALWRDDASALAADVADPWTFAGFAVGFAISIAIGVGLGRVLKNHRDSVPDDDFADE